MCVFHDIVMSIMALAGLKNVVWNESFMEAKMLQFPSLFFLSANNTCSGSGCSHICLLSAARAEGFTCMCPDGYSLGENGRECNCKPM